MNVLALNTYGGSLLLAARAAGFGVIGSYEDAGYGSDVQAANFPDVPIIKKVPWPKQDLTDVIVIAHPPCSAFSVQNNQRKKNPKKGGLTSDAFQCTRRVLKYGMHNNAAAILVESVVPAMEGARRVHDGFARQNGYRLFRVLQNAASFGVPQDRKRFWAVFIRKNLIGSRWFVYHVPKFVTIRSVVKLEDEPFPQVQKSFNIQLELMAKRGLPKETVMKLFGAESYGNILAVYRRVLAPRRDPAVIARKHAPTPFSSAVIRVLDPDRPATAILGVNTWVYRGRPIGAADQKAIMGFPRDYVFPDYREAPAFLARGICPPVGAWLLTEVDRTIRGKRPLPPGSYTHQVAEGEILDLRGEVANAPWEVREKKVDKVEWRLDE